MIDRFAERRARRALRDKLNPLRRDDKSAE
jgi:hypothetical protein